MHRMHPPQAPEMILVSTQHTAAALQGSCRAVPPETRAGQNFCGSDDRCRNHDETAWCADSTLSPCPLLRPTIGGDCKLAGNLFAQFGNAGGAAQPAALAAGVHFGPSAICLGVPGGRFARTGVSAWRLSETCFASECDDSGALTVLVRDAEGEGFSRYPCPKGEMITLPVEDGFEEGVRAVCCVLHCIAGLHALRHVMPDIRRVQCCVASTATSVGMYGPVFH